jgi:hypothetical protein
VLEVIITSKGFNIPITAIPVIGSAQTPSVGIQETFDTPIECFKATKRIVPITLDNMREIETGIVWGYNICSDEFSEEDILVEFSCDGKCDDKLENLQTKQFDVQITCFKVGNLKLDVYCGVEGMVENGGKCFATMTVKCLGLSVEISIPKLNLDESSDFTEPPEICEISSQKACDHTLNMNFGSLALFEIKKRIFTIRNTSGVTSKFSIAPTEYTTTPTSDTTAKEGMFSHEAGIFSRRAQEKMSSLPMDCIGFTTEHGKKYISHITKARRQAGQINMLLKERKGVGFQVEPSVGVLLPFSEIVIQVNLLLTLRFPHITTSRSITGIS